MTTFTDTVSSLWRVLVAALVLGAGLPALFALGVRWLAEGLLGDDGKVAEHPAVAKYAGWGCLVTVAVVVVLGILFIMKDFLANDLGIHIF